MYFNFLKMEFKDSSEDIKSEIWVDKSEIEELFRYIPKECHKEVVEFINSLTNLEPKTALKEVDEYIKKLLKKGILDIKNKEEVVEMKREYNEENEGFKGGEDVFKKNYEEVKFKGEGYGFIPGDKNPYFKAAMLKIGKAFESPNIDNEETSNKYLLGGIDILLFEFYSKYEKAIEGVTS